MQPQHYCNGCSSHKTVLSQMHLLMSYCLLKFDRLKDRTANLCCINCVSRCPKHKYRLVPFKIYYCVWTFRYNRIEIITSTQDEILISTSPYENSQHSMASMNYFLNTMYNLREKIHASQVVFNQILFFFYLSNILADRYN